MAPAKWVCLPDRRPRCTLTRSLSVSHRHAVGHPTRPAVGRLGRTTCWPRLAQGTSEPSSPRGAIDALLRLMLASSSLPVRPLGQRSISGRAHRPRSLGSAGRPPAIPCEMSRGLGRYVAKRLGLAGLMLAGVSVILFTLMRLAPGGPEAPGRSSSTSGSADSGSSSRPTPTTPSRSTSPARPSTGSSLWPPTAGSISR